MSAQIQRIDCGTRREIYRMITRAVNKVVILAEPGVGSSSEKADASLCLENLRHEYQTHTSSHGCILPDNRLKIVKPN